MTDKFKQLHVSFYHFMLMTESNYNGPTDIQQRNAVCINCTASDIEKVPILLTRTTRICKIERNKGSFNGGNGV